MIGWKNGLMYKAKLINGFIDKYWKKRNGGMYGFFGKMKYTSFQVDAQMDNELLNVQVVNQIYG